MRLRARVDEDLDSCEHLARVVHELDGYPPRLADDLRLFVEAPGAVGSWVAESGGGIVGHVVLQPTSSDPVMALASQVTGRAPAELGVIARLLVSPAERRKGLGTSLLAIAADAALARGLWPILDVAASFGPAIRLYQRTGWVCAGQVTVRLPESEPLDEFVYIGPAPQ